MTRGAQKGLALTLAGVVIVVAGVALASVFPSASNQGYAPEQPIPFSHKLHAGTNKIACTYCHSGAEKSRHATVPAMNVCMNCHSVVKTDSPHIQKIRKAYEEGKPIEWVRIHELPDFVYFPHKRHVAKGVACETCHGNVKEMDRLYQVAPLTMGWCLDCHRGQTTPRQVLARMMPKDANHAQATGTDRGPHRYLPIGPTNCTACHN